MASDDDSMMNSTTCRVVDSSGIVEHVNCSERNLLFTCEIPMENGEMYYLIYSSF